MRFASLCTRIVYHRLLSGSPNNRRWREEKVVDKKMKYAQLVMLSTTLICTVAFAGEVPQMQEGKTVAEQARSMAQAPSGLHLKIVENGFQLTWALSPQDPGAVDGYEIVRSDRFSGPYERVATVGKGISQYHDPSAFKEIIYFFKVRAIVGKEFSPFSNTVTGER